jgi:dipeptidyl-peptidase-4
MFTILHLNKQRKLLTVKKMPFINGITDWVYEGVCFCKSFDWSADSKKLAYIRFDERFQSSMSMFNKDLYPVELLSIQKREKKMQFSLALV